MQSRQCRFASWFPGSRFVQPESVHPKQSSLKTLVVALTVSAAGVLIVLVFILLLWYHKILKLKRSKTSPDDGVSCKLHKFSYRELKRATNFFNQAHKLGKGGFGVVYRGVLRDGKEVAVKKLVLSSLQGEREFRNELSICGRLKSNHIVGLLGYSTHGKRVRLLVYECMQNRSLQEALFEKSYAGVQLDWERRFKIILDTAKGLAYLHLECDPPVIHGDIKPSNVLLDGNFSAYIADFGLARLKTEDVCGEGRGPSASTEKSRPDTPDKFRLDTPERSGPDTPERFQPETPERRKGSRAKRSPKDVDGGGEELKQMGDRQVVIDVEEASALQEPRNLVEGESVPSSHIGSPHVGRSGNEDGCCDVQSLCVPAEGEISGATVLQLENAESPQGEAGASTGGNPTDQNGNVLAANGSRDLQKLPKKALHKKKSSGKDWWWKQESSGELRVKEYVMDWIGTEFTANDGRREVEAKEGNVEEIIVVGEEKEGGTRKEKGREVRKSRLSGVVVGQEEEQKKKQGEGSSGILELGARKKEKKGRQRQRKSREWWKDEYFAELSNKSKAKGRGSRTDILHSQSQKQRQFSGELSRRSGELSRYSGELRRVTMRATKRERHPNGSDNDLSFAWFGERQGGGGAGAAPGGNNSDLLQQHHQQQWSGELSRGDVSSTTSMRGTVCYVAPEYGGSGILSEKSDIYSLGVLLLVIISGRRPIQIANNNSSAASSCAASSPPPPMRRFERANLISWARNLSHTGNVLDLVDERLHGRYDRGQVHVCITLALMCIQRLPSSRPTISQVLNILLGHSPVPPFPLEFSPSPPSRLSYRSPPLRPSSIVSSEDTA